MFLVDDAAIDAARVTGCCWSFQRIESRGPWRPFVNLTELTWKQRWVLAWSMIGAHVFADNNEGDNDGVGDIRAAVGGCRPGDEAVP